MAAEFPARPPVEQPPEPTIAGDDEDVTDDDMDDWRFDAAAYEVEKALAKHGVTLADDVISSLVVTVAYCWMMGMMGYHPGPLYRSRGSAKGSGGCFSVRGVWRAILQENAGELDAQAPASGAK